MTQTREQLAAEIAAAIGAAVLGAKAIDPDKVRAAWRSHLPVPTSDEIARALKSLGWRRTSGGSFKAPGV